MASTLHRTIHLSALGALAALGLACAQPADPDDVADMRAALTTTTEEGAPGDWTPASRRPRTTTTTEAPTTTVPAPTTTTVPPTTTTTAPPESAEVTNARRAAANYLDLMPFSRTGLIGQLEFEGYPTEAATVAVDGLGADWHAQAVRSAENYVDLMPFSHSGLVSQLEFEGYSTDEATHGANAVLGG